MVFKLFFYLCASIGYFVQFTIMRILFYIITICIIVSCDPKPITSDTIYCKVTTWSKTNNSDSILFSSESIISFNETTGELKLKKTFSEKQLATYGNFKFYLGTDSLFSARYAVDYMSSFVNDLVFYNSLYEQKLFLNDGYPNWIDNIGTNSVRDQNKTKRAANWKRFLDALKLQNKIIK